MLKLFHCKLRSFHRSKCHIQRLGQACHCHQRRNSPRYRCQGRRHLETSFRLNVNWKSRQTCFKALPFSAIVVGVPSDAVTVTLPAPAYNSRTSQCTIALLVWAPSRSSPTKYVSLEPVTRYRVSLGGPPGLWTSDYRC